MSSGRTTGHAGSRGHTPSPPLDRDIGATTAIAAYSLAVAFGFARVFSGWQYMVELTLLVLIGHGGSFLLRRARISGWLAVPAITVALLWTLAGYRYSSTLTGFVPWRETWSQFRLDMTVVRDQFQTAVAPVIYDVGWATLAGLAMVLVIVMADAFAFRAEARGEALVPGGVLFVFVAALGSPRLRIESTVLLIASGVLLVVALRALHDRTRRVELAAGRRTGRLLPGAVAVAAFVAVAAGVVGPRIPGADAEPLYETRGRGGGITEVLSPLVDIRSRLVNRGNVELFRVNADTEAYWRQTTLPEFDGSTFRLPRRSLTRIDDDLFGAGGREIRQQIQILSLGGPLLPAAADPEAVLPNEDIRLNTDTSTLVKTSDLEPREVFTIVSRTPDITPEVLRAATTDNAPDDVFTDLPGDFPESVAEIAREVTAGATTDYDRMLALQTYFRGFTYSLEVQAGHGSSAIENFLAIQTGYCEQFSATMAAMARTLGVPSRVAVGFTPGILGDDGWYSVLGRNAHAWPEIWFDGVGWVPFEPTPSRGIPGAENVTGVPAAQDTTPPQAPSDGETGAGTVPPTPTTVFQPPSTAAERPETPAGSGRPEAPVETTTATPATGGDSLPWPLLAVIVAALAMAAVPALARRIRIRRARHLATPERVAAAWQRACRDAARAGVAGRPSMTSHEWADATAAQLPVAARPMASLATTLDRVEFAHPDDAATTRPEMVDECEVWAAQVGRIATDTLPVTRRAARYFSEWN